MMYLVTLVSVRPSFRHTPSSY